MPEHFELIHYPNPPIFKMFGIGFVNSEENNTISVGSVSLAHLIRQKKKHFEYEEHFTYEIQCY